MKVSIYELLGMVKDGKAPKKIKYKNIIWYFNKKNKTYYIEDTTIELFYIEKLTERLNDEVEIIEEEKKIPEKIEYYDDSIAWVIDDIGQLSDVDKVIVDKLNEVLEIYLESKGE